MKLCKDTLVALVKELGISQNQMANQIGVCRGSLSNALSGKRGVGRKTLIGLLQLFPDETVESLTLKRQVAL